MIAASGRAADDIVAVVQPGFGTATVEGIAINAVMAGCRPEYMRTLIAALDAAWDQFEDFGWNLGDDGTFMRSIQ